MNRLFFLMFLTLLTSTVYSQTNGLNVYGGEIKTIAMGNQNVSISNYYFPEDQFKVYVQEFIDEISLSAENKNVLLDSLSALADQNTSLTESVEYYEKYVRFLEAKVRELDIQIQAATNNYLQLSREVIAGTGNLISSGYDVISVEDAGTIRYAFDKEKIINDPSLLILFEFNNGIAIAKKSNKYGFVNISGQLITDIKYDYVEQFSCDLALVKNHSRYGYINVRGKEVIDLKYIEAKSFSNDYASVSPSLGYWYIINTAGRTKMSQAYGEIGLIDENGYAVAISYDESDWRLIDFRGRVKLFGFEGLKQLSEGLYAAKRNGLWGFITVDGDISIPYKYQQVTRFHNNRSIVTANQCSNCVGVIDKFDLQVIPLVFTSVKYVSNNFHMEKLLPNYGNLSFIVNHEGKCISGECERYLEMINID